MFHMINERALLLKFDAHYLASIFIHFKIILQVLRVPKWVLFRLKIFLLEDLRTRNLYQR